MWMAGLTETATPFRQPTPRTSAAIPPLRSRSDQLTVAVAFQPMDSIKNNGRVASATDEVLKTTSGRLKL